MRSPQIAVIAMANVPTAVAPSISNFVIDSSGIAMTLLPVVFPGNDQRTPRN